MEVFKIPITYINREHFLISYMEHFVKLSCGKMPAIRVSIYLEFKLLKCLNLILWNTTQESHKTRIICSYHFQKLAVKTSQHSSWGKKTLNNGHFDSVAFKYLTINYTIAH